MNGALAPALLCATVGLMLSFGASRRAVWSGVVATIAAAILASALPVAPDFQDSASTGCWIGVAVAAACMHLPRPFGLGTAVALGLAGGAWTGITVAAAGRPVAIAAAILVVIALPGASLVASSRGLFVKVAGSWLAAAAVLSLGLGMVPTLGSAPDHRE